MSHAACFCCDLCRKLDSAVDHSQVSRHDYEAISIVKLDRKRQFASLSLEKASLTPYKYIKPIWYEK